MLFQKENEKDKEKKSPTPPIKEKEKEKEKDDDDSYVRACAYVRTHAREKLNIRNIANSLSFHFVCHFRIHLRRLN